MQCDRCLNLLPAHVDGELSRAETAEVEAHLVGCAACQAELDALAAQDVALDGAFAPRRAAAEGVATAALERIATLAPAQAAPPAVRQPRFWLGPVKLFAAAAAGFLLAVLILRPGTPPPAPVVIAPPTTHPAARPPATAPAPIATLALATGAIEVCYSGDADWRPLATGGAVPADTRVRTGAKVRCEFKTPDGSEIRLNELTEVHLRTPRTFDLSAGRAWSTVAKAPEPFRVQVAAAVLTAMGTQFDVQADPRKTVLTVLEGAVAVRAAQQEQTVRAGHRVEWVGDSLGTAQRVYNLVEATRWVNELLVLKGNDNPELAARVNDLMAQLGQAKMEHLAEQEIRSLGFHCAGPLGEYVRSDRSAEPGAHERRISAARILADVATTASIPDLISLLADADGDVRYHAARGLHRLTNQEQARPEAWRTKPPAQMASEYRAMHDWWMKNRDRYPGASKEIPTLHTPLPVPSKR